MTLTKLDDLVLECTSKRSIFQFGYERESMLELSKISVSISSSNTL